jgi:hypothetical protein
MKHKLRIYSSWQPEGRIISAARAAASQYSSESWSFVVLAEFVDLLHLFLLQEFISFFGLALLYRESGSRPLKRSNLLEVKRRLKDF